MTYTADITGFPYWKDNISKTEDWLDEEMLKNEKLIKEKKSLKNENKFYLKKIEKLKKKNKEEWESGTEKIGQQLSDALEEIKKLKQEIRELKCKYDAERLARAPRLWNELKEENKELKDRLHWKDKEIKAYEKEAENHGQITLAQEEKIKKLKEELHNKDKSAYFLSCESYAGGEFRSGEDWDRYIKDLKYYLEQEKDEWDCTDTMKDVWKEYVDWSGIEVEEEDPDCCESCGKTFDLRYTMNHCDPELRKKYDKYFGSSNDDGDMCPECMSKEEDYKSFGVMFVEDEDSDEDDIDFFDTEQEAEKLMCKMVSSNKTSPHPLPQGKLILFRSHKYNPDYDNKGTIPIVKEMKI